MTLVLAEFPSRQYADAFAQVTRARAEAVFVSPSLLAFADRALVVELATGLGCLPCLRIGSRWSSGG